MPVLDELRALEGRAQAIPGTEEFVFNQTMLRVKDPGRSLDFYINVMGMTLIKEMPFPSMEFTLYFLGYVRAEDEQIPKDGIGRAAYAFRQKAMLELTHNWGTEDDDEFGGYHSGNEDPRGFGHIGMYVPDVDTACERFEALGVEFVKRPNDGRMKGLAFIKDPDGYWIEILEANNSAFLVIDLGGDTVPPD